MKNAKIYRVRIEEGKAGLFYATSPQDLRGLLVGKPTIDELFAAIPDTIAALVEAATGELPMVLLAERGDDPMVHPFVAVPFETVRKALAEWLPEAKDRVEA